MGIIRKPFENEQTQQKTKWALEALVTERYQ